VVQRRVQQGTDIQFFFFFFFFETETRHFLLEGKLGRSLQRVVL
jgi:hypothetical protein